MTDDDYVLLDYEGGYESSGDEDREECYEQ